MFPANDKTSDYVPGIISVTETKEVHPMKTHLREACMTYFKVHFTHSVTPHGELLSGCFVVTMAPILED